MSKIQGKTLVALFLGAAALIGGIGLTVSSAWLITMAAQHPPILVLGVSIVLVRFFGISRSAARYGERVMSHESVFRKLTSIRVNLFEKLASRSAELVRDFNSGSFVKSIVDDVERAQEYQLRVTLPGYSTVLAVIFGVIVAAWIYPWTLWVVTPISLLLTLGIPLWVNRTCVQLSKKIEDHENEYARKISEYNYGVSEAVFYGYQDAIAVSLHESEVKMLKSERKLIKSIQRLQTFSLLLFGATLLGIAELMWERSQSSEIAPVKIAMAIFLPLVLFEGITTWYPNLFNSGKLLRAEKTIEQLLEETSSITESSPISPIGRKLVLRGVRAKWADHFMVPIDLEVHSGETVVIRGKNGSGKSTLALALTGLLPYDGSITIDDVELRNIADLSLCIAASLQRGHIFRTTLRENLKIGNSSATEEEIQRIISLLELDAIPLDELLGEFGRPISGGEAKRVGVARALLSNSTIIVLDEPTEHLDRELAERIEARIKKECETKCLIVITHSGWLKSDRTVNIARE